jgi:hypothetical protein
MTMLFRRNSLRKVDIDEVSNIAGAAWARTWRKLKIDPHLSNERVLIGEVRIAGKDAFPIMAQLGYCSELDVAKVLIHSLSLSENESLEFIRCTRNRDSIIEIVEERLVSYNGDGDDD